MTTSLNIEQARSHFPALNSGYIFADNAGGSQIAKDVVDRISDYLINTNVQLNVDYSISIQSTQRVAEGPKVAARLFNAASPDEIIFGASSTANMENLVKTMEGDIQPGDEFILMSGEHDSNNGTWKKLAARCGATVKQWHATPSSPHNPYSLTHRIEDCIPFISENTRIVAFSACSNILGSVVPVREISQAVHAAAAACGAKKVQISVDCVAYAPHRRIDVQDWDIDFCTISFYKIYGPHGAALYVRSRSRQPAAATLAHELVYGTTGVLPYLLSLTPYNDLHATFAAITAHEQTLVAPLLAFLTHPAQAARGVLVVGSEQAGPTRVPTVSFVVRGEQRIESRELARMVNRKGGVGIRWYPYICYEAGDSRALDDGVARVSLVHYNTVEEVNKIIEILEEILSS